jgi:hypothetical protein
MDLAGNGRAQLLTTTPKNHRRFTIAKNQNTFAKRNREMEKKRKADEKRVDRQKRKEEGPLPEADPATLAAQHPDNQHPDANLP